MRSAGLASVFIAMQLAIPSGVASAADASAPQSAMASPASAANPQPPAPAAAMPASPMSSASTPSPSASVPAPAPNPAPIVGHAEAGSRIYSAICAYCHHLDEAVSDVGAPGLEGAFEEHGAAWLDRWLADPRGFADSDATARALIAANPYGLVMPAFPAMQDAQNRADVIAFLQSLGETGKESQPAQ